MPGIAPARKRLRCIGNGYAHRYLRRGMCASWRSPTVNSAKWRITLEKAVNRPRNLLRNCNFSEPHRSVSRCLARNYARGSVSERRFPTSHSRKRWLVTTASSVSERRFPTSHSNLVGDKRRSLVYPSDDSPQATATFLGCGQRRLVYPSDDSPQATAC